AEGHRVDQVDAVLGDPFDGLARFGRASGDEDDRDVQAHRRHQVARSDLVAVGDAHQRVGGGGVDHVFDRVRDQVPAGQRVEHPAVAHGDAVIDGDGVELLGDAPGLLDGAGDQVAQVLQVHVPRYELRVGVRDGDDRFAEVRGVHAGRAPEG